MWKYNGIFMTVQVFNNSVDQLYSIEMNSGILGTNTIAEKNNVHDYDRTTCWYKCI